MEQMGLKAESPQRHNTYNIPVSNLKLNPALNVTDSSYQSGILNQDTNTSPVSSPQSFARFEDPVGYISQSVSRKAPFISNSHTQPT